MVYRIVNKLYRELYLLRHPKLWGKSVQINGIPHIGNISNLFIGRHVSFNDNILIQCSGEAVRKL